MTMLCMNRKRRDVLTLLLLFRNSLKNNFFFITVDVSASTEAVVGTVCVIAVCRSVSGRTGCRRRGRVGKTPLSVHRLVLLLPDIYRLINEFLNSNSLSFNLRAYSKILTLLPDVYGCSRPTLWKVISGTGSPSDWQINRAGLNSSCSTSLSSSTCGFTAHVITRTTSLTCGRSIYENCDANEANIDTAISRGRSEAEKNCS